mgnify:CR=1 FL=1
MKRILTIIFASMMVLAVSAPVEAQDKKAERQARKAEKKREREIKDSLMNVMRMAEKDSVNVGYGYTKKEDLNSAVTRKKTHRTIDSFNDIADYIQGTVPGVIVQKSGGTVRYIIRGVSTNSDFTDPLLMIDGVEVDNFDSVIPSQVESVEVIKDGSASIYGIRGGGGVIMLTLKKE